jgi:hypothetical protein
VLLLLRDRLSEAHQGEVANDYRTLLGVRYRDTV